MGALCGKPAPKTKNTDPNTGSSPAPVREPAPGPEPSMTKPKAEPDANLKNSNQTKKPDIDPKRNKSPSPKNPKAQLSKPPPSGPTLNPNYPNPNYSEMPSAPPQPDNPSLLKNSPPEPVMPVKIDTDKSDSLSPAKSPQQQRVNYNYPSKLSGIGQEIRASGNHHCHYSSEMPGILEAPTFADPPVIDRLFDGPPVGVGRKKTSEFGTGVESGVMVRGATFGMPESGGQLFSIGDLGGGLGLGAMNFGESHFVDPGMESLGLEGTPIDVSGIPVMINPEGMGQGVVSMHENFKIKPTTGYLLSNSSNSIRK